jgi:hypothetical protein
MGLQHYVCGRGAAMIVSVTGASSDASVSMTPRIATRSTHGCTSGPARIVT